MVRLRSGSGRFRLTGIRVDRDFPEESVEICDWLLTADDTTKR